MSKNTELAVLATQTTKIKNIQQLLIDAVHEMQKAKYQEASLESSLSLAIDQTVKQIDLAIERLNKIDKK